MIIYLVLVSCRLALGTVGFDLIKGQPWVRLNWLRRQLLLRIKTWGRD